MANLPLEERPSLVLYDADQESNKDIQLAQWKLGLYLRSRAARVSVFVWPDNHPKEQKGVDDWLAAAGPDPVWEHINAAFLRPFGPPDLKPVHFADVGDGPHRFDARTQSEVGRSLENVAPLGRQKVGAGRDPQSHARGARNHGGVLEQSLEDEDEHADARKKFAHASLAHARLHAALEIAKSEVAPLPKDFDQDPHLMNFQNGVVDLSTGVLSRHRRGDNLTRVPDYPYDEKAACVRWEKFLEEVMGVSPNSSEAHIERALARVRFLKRAGLLAYPPHPRESRVPSLRPQGQQRQNHSSRHRPEDFSEKSPPPLGSPWAAAAELVPEMKLEDLKREPDHAMDPEGLGLGRRALLSQSFPILV